MPSSLIHEPHISFPTAVAATLGLEEAVMLQVLAECSRHRQGQRHEGLHWVKLSVADALQLMPFWAEEDLERISQKLQALGIIRLGSASIALGNGLQFAFADSAETEAPRQATAPKPAPTRPNQDRGAKPIGEDWRPGPELLRKLQEINGVPQEFALQLVPEFTTYWRDRQSTTFSWESRFMSHAQRQWQQQAGQRSAVEAAAAQARTSGPMVEAWRPSEDAMTILLRSGIEQQFIEDAIPEFILYWRDRGDVSNTWDTRFIAHIRRQWTRYESSREFTTEPQRISSDWCPSEDVYDILRMANIDVEFARQQVPEFVVYWRDTNQVYSSWNSRFLQHVKTCWARRLNGPQGTSNYGQGHQSAVEPDRRGFVEKHTDPSWRDGL